MMGRPQLNDEKDEQEVIRQVLSGAKEEYRHLVAAHQSQIYAMMLRQVGDPQLAEELTQDAFVRAYRSLETFRFDSRFSTWLIRIAINRSRSYFASRQFKESQRCTAFDKHQHEPHADQAESDTPYAKQDLDRLRAAIQQLNPKFRDVLVLCSLEQKSYQEAANLLGIRVGTVRSRLNRARHKLQTLYFEV